MKLDINVKGNLNIDFDDQDNLVLSGTAFNLKAVVGDEVEEEKPEEKTGKKEEFKLNVRTFCCDADSEEKKEALTDYLTLGKALGLIDTDFGEDGNDRSRKVLDDVLKDALADAYLAFGKAKGIIKEVSEDK